MQSSGDHHHDHHQSSSSARKKQRRDEEARRNREETAAKAKMKLNEIMLKMAVLVEDKNKSPRSNIYNASANTKSNNNPLAMSSNNNNNSCSTHQDSPHSNSVSPRGGGGYHTTYNPTIPEDEPLRNGAGTVGNYRSALVAKKKATQHNAFTFSKSGGPENDLHPPPKERFVMGSPRNQFVSKTSQSTAFAHWQEAHDAAKQQVRNGRYAGQSMSPKDDLVIRRKEERLPGAFRSGQEGVQGEGSLVCTIDNMCHPYANILDSGREKKQKREGATEMLRNEIVENLRKIVPQEEVVAKTDPRRDYDYAHGVQVSVPLESEQPPLRGKRVYPGIDEDYSPVVGLGLQPHRSGKEGKVERRKHLANQDMLTIRLDKKKYLQEDTSIFSPKNMVVRQGLTSVETKGDSRRLGMALPDIKSSPSSSPRSGAAATTTYSPRTFERSNDIVTQQKPKTVWEAPVYAGGSGGGQQAQQPRTVLLHNGYRMMGSPRVLPSSDARLDRFGKM